MRKILIIDDNPRVRSLIKGELAELDAEFYEGSDGQEAFELYGKHQPEWVLMDWQMKEMDGITATKQIIKQFPTAYICMVTSFDSEHLKKEARQAGASNFVLKDDLSPLREILTGR